MPELTTRPVPRPAMPNQPNRPNGLVCERGDSNPHGFPRQILSLSALVWLHIERSSLTLLRRVFGGAWRGVARAGERIVPPYVPPTAYIPREADRPAQPSSYDLAGVRS